MELAHGKMLVSECKIYLFLGISVFPNLYASQFSAFKSLLKFNVIQKAERQGALLSDTTCSQQVDTESQQENTCSLFQIFWKRAYNSEKSDLMLLGPTCKEPNENVKVKVRIREKRNTTLFLLVLFY